MKIPHARASFVVVSEVVSPVGALMRPVVQVTFEGRSLHTYVGDSRPGQAGGQGIDGFVVAAS